MTEAGIESRLRNAGLAATAWHPDAGGPAAILLHAGICDRRSWNSLAAELPDHRLIAYDRRGHGETPPARDHDAVADLLTVLDAVGPDPAWLVGSSAGGALAVDAALAAPERVAGLVLIAPAVSGAPAPDKLEPAVQPISDAMDTADAAGDLDEVNRLEVLLWLDGPAGPEGRVAGPARDLLLRMNAIVLHNEGDEQPTPATARDGWARLADVHPPTTVVWGSLELQQIIERCQELVRRLPDARGIELAGMAHLPYLEDPGAVADVVRHAIGS